MQAAEDKCNSKEGNTNRKLYLHLNNINFRRQTVINIYNYIILHHNPKNSILRTFEKAYYLYANIL